MVFVFLLLVVVAGYWVYVYRTMKLDEEEEQMRTDTIELRKILQITKKDGYVLSTENVWLAGSKYVIIPKVQMEAAVRLWRLEDFDIDAFDALCVLVADMEYHSVGGDKEVSHDTCTNSEASTKTNFSSRRAWHGGEESAHGETSLHAGDPEAGVLPGESGASRPHRQQPQLDKMRRWLLEHASATLAAVSMEDRFVHAGAQTHVRV